MGEQTAKKIAHAVVEAENAAGDKGRDQVDDLLSRHFIRLTRGGKPARGEQEGTREQFLAGIEGASPNGPKRCVEFNEHPGAWPIGSECWIVRGDVTTHNKNASERDRRFRNTWVLRLDEDHRWRLAALQVTRLQS
jgi:hypothetical protein